MFYDPEDRAAELENKIFRLECDLEEAEEECGEDSDEADSIRWEINNLQSDLDEVEQEVARERQKDMECIRASSYRW